MMNFLALTEWRFADFDSVLGLTCSNSMGMIRGIVSREEQEI